jgi:hypothetical protein
VAVGGLRQAREERLGRAIECCTLREAVGNRPEGGPPGGQGLWGSGSGGLGGPVGQLGRSFPSWLLAGAWT